MNKFNSKILKKPLFKIIKNDFEKINLHFNFLTVMGVLGAGVITSIFLYWLTLKIFLIRSVACIISFPMILSGFFIIRFLSNNKQKKLEEVMEDFFIQLKGALKINGDIIEAFRRIQNSVLEPFREYIIMMLKEINSGIMPEEALLEFANKVGIKKFSYYINNLRYSNIYGGNNVMLTIETQKLIGSIIKEKKKRIKETNSICIVLYVLLGIDLIVYFSFIVKNNTYMDIMIKNSMGKFIIDGNFITIWLVFFMIMKIKKLDF